MRGASFSATFHVLDCFTVRRNDTLRLVTRTDYSPFVEPPLRRTAKRDTGSNVRCGHYAILHALRFSIITKSANDVGKCLKMASSWRHVHWYHTK